MRHARDSAKETVKHVCLARLHRKTPKEKKEHSVMQKHFPSEPAHSVFYVIQNGFCWELLENFEILHFCTSHPTLNLPQGVWVKDSVHPKMEILIIYSQSYPSQRDFLSSVEDKRRYLRRVFVHSIKVGSIFFFFDIQYWQNRRKEVIQVCTNTWVSKLFLFLVEISI